MTPPTSKPDLTTPTAVTHTDASVAAFLVAHPEFFDRHQSLLATLRLPHQRGDSATVSLIERQLDILRDRARDTELRLKTLLDNGHANDLLAEKMHRLAIRLLACHDLPARLAVIESSLRDEFGAHDFILLLCRPSTRHEHLSSHYLRVVPADHPDLKSFELLFSSGKPRCGRIRDSQRDFLFPSSPNAIGSVALVPLGPHGAIGLLAIASPDVDHFNPTMSTDFLARIGELIATALHDHTPHAT